MKSFYSFFEQAGDSANQPPERINDSLVTTFGRHNPPHMGHGLTFDKAHEIAGNEDADQRFYTSQSQDRKKNPLPRDLKLKFLKKMFPKHADKWDADDNVHSILQAASKAHQDGYRDFHFVGGGDRKEGIENLLRKYNGNLFDFKNIYGHSAGERDGEDPLAQLSASKLRGHAQKGDLQSFMQGMPKVGKQFTNADIKELFDAVQMYGMQNEEYTPDELRELYNEGLLYEPGDIVESLSNGMVGGIHRCGANHLIVVTEDGIMFKSFIHDVISI